MSKITITEAHDLGNDILRVRGTVEGRTQPVEGDEQHVVFTATGWVSALTNHYPPEAYDENGALKLKPEKNGAPGDPEHDARKMTKAEQLDYCRSLIQAVVDAEPKPLDISG